MFSIHCGVAIHEWNKIGAISTSGEKASSGLVHLQHPWAAFCFRRAQNLRRLSRLGSAASAVSVVINASSQLLPQIQILHTADKLPASNRTQLVKAFKCSFDLIEVIFETPRVSHPPTRDQPGSKTYKDRSSIAFSYRPNTNQRWMTRDVRPMIGEN